MAHYIFQGDFQNQEKRVSVKLLLIHFEDENKVHFIYSPHLDLTGYGKNLMEAKSSFEVVFEDFVDYTLKKETLGKVLMGLGWKLKGAAKRPKKVIAPSITSVINDNKFVSEIFDKYPVNTYHQEVGIPVFVQITLQTHIDPVPEFIVKQVLRHLNMDKKTFLEEFNKL